MLLFLLLIYAFIKNTLLKKKPFSKYVRKALVIFIVQLDSITHSKIIPEKKNYANNTIELFHLIAYI